MSIQTAKPRRRIVDAEVAHDAYAFGNLPSAKPSHPTISATPAGRLGDKVLIDLVEGNSAADRQRWTENADSDRLGGIAVVLPTWASPPGRALAALSHARRVRPVTDRRMATR